MRSLFSRGLSVPVHPCVLVVLGGGVGLRPREASGRWGQGAAALSVRQGKNRGGRRKHLGVLRVGFNSAPRHQDAALPSAPSAPWAVPRLLGECHHALP